MLLFIDDSESFITKSIIKKVESQGNTCKMIHLRVNELAQCRNDIEGYIFYNIADMAAIDDKGFTYMKDLCIENGYKLYMMGYDDDITDLINRFGLTMKVGRFPRPINAMEVAEQINMLASEENNIIKQHILVVDDSGVMLNTIHEWLHESYNVALSNSASNALTYLANHKPDLILLDYEMPICSGPQLFEMLKADASLKDIPVIFLTGKADAESVKAVLALHPAGYLLKSRPKEEIVRDIKKFFGEI